MKELKEHILVQKWVNEVSQVVKMRYPDMDMKFIKRRLYNILKKRIVNAQCELYNNYEDLRLDLDLLNFTDWYEKKKPIPGGHGVLFKTHDQAPNPSAELLNKFINLRKIYKGKKFEWEEISTRLNKEKEAKKNDPSNVINYDEEIAKAKELIRKYDRKQLAEKINANAFYGASGLKTSVFFNLHVALAITGKGQILISVAAMAFEKFLANNVLFQNMDECLVFIKNVVDEEKFYNDKDILDKHVTIDMVYNRLKETFMDRDDCDKRLLYGLLNNLSQIDLNRIYYKNNIYEFCRNSKIKELIRTLYNSEKVIQNPALLTRQDKVSVEAYESNKELWSLLNEYVFYNYPVFERVFRLKNYKRRSVIVIDTDSFYKRWESLNHVNCGNFLRA